MNGIDEHQEKKLRDLLREMGGGAERRAPAFQRVWRTACEAPSDRETKASRARLKWTFAVALVVLGTFVAVIMTHHPDSSFDAAMRDDHTMQPAPPAADAFEQEEPTDFLLAENREPTASRVEQLAREIDALLRP